MSNDPARIGVIGTGWWATQHHIPSLLAYEGARLTSLADTDANKLEAAAEHFGIDAIYTDHRDMLASGRVDGVVIATPHASHYPIARDALDAGVHVLLEKPMALHAPDARDLVERAAQRGLHILVGYTFHYTEHARLAHEIVRSGRIGTVQLVSGIFSSIVRSFFAGRPEDYRDILHPFRVTGPRTDSYSDPAICGGGQGQTQATHALGMALWVTGARPVEAFAYMESHSLDVDLVDAVTFRLDGGEIGTPIGTLAATGNLRPGQRQQQGWTYFGSIGVLHQDMVGGRLSIQLHDAREESFRDLPDDQIYPGEAPARALADVISGVGENRSPGSSGAHVVELLECAYRSSSEGRAVRVEELG